MGNAEKISITLPPEMLDYVKDKVQAGSYGSTSEVIREAMRLWKKQEDEHELRLNAIRQKLQQSAESGPCIPLEDAFTHIQKIHENRKKTNQV